MAKLLEFKPNEKGKAEDKLAYEKIRKRIQQDVDEDILYNFTPDLPHLRYRGPQLVFLYDDMKHWSSLEALNLVSNKDFFIDAFSAVTKSHYIPFQNMLSANGKGFKYYLIRSSNWPDIVNERDLERFDTTPLPVSGRLISCSLEALMALDQHYCNGHVFQRSKINVFPTLQTETDKFVWAYCNRLGSIAKFDPHSQTYSFGSYIELGNMQKWRPAGKPNVEVYQSEQAPTHYVMGRAS